MAPKLCPNVRTCGTYAELEHRPASRVLRILFCESDFTRCERFRLAIAGDVVPADLLPDGRTRPTVAQRPVGRLKLRRA